MGNNETSLTRAGVTTSWGIPELVSDGASGKIRVPTFQRSFVWDAANVRELFDSIYKGFPIGTFLLWEHPAAANTLSLGGFDIKTAASDDALLVVDGQQRLTSLVAALSPAIKTDDERFEVYFDLERKRFVGPARSGRPIRAIPVRETLESRRLLSWLRDHADELEDGDLDVADELGGALRDYKAAVYVVRDSREEVLREVFDRVNSAGKPISRAQIFHALFASHAPGASPDAVSQRLSETGFGRIDSGRIVQSVLAIRGGDVQRDLHEEFRSDEDPEAWYDTTEQALRLAIQFLQDEGIPHLRLLPTTLPIPVLATFFFLHPQPTDWERRQLARWIWRGWILGFGAESGQTPVLRRSVRVLNPLKLDLKAAPAASAALSTLIESLPAASAPELPAKLDTKASLGRLALVALASIGPRFPDGGLIDVGAAIDEKGLDAVGMLIASGSKADLGRRGFWQSTWGPLSGLEAPETLESHAVNHAAARALLRGDGEDFAKARWGAIDEIFMSFLRRKLDHGVPTQHPPSDLIVPDE